MRMRSVVLGVHGGVRAEVPALAPALAPASVHRRWQWRRRRRRLLRPQSRGSNRRMKSSGTTRHSGPVLSAPLVDASAALFSWVFIEERSRGRSRTGEAFWRFLERVGGGVNGANACAEVWFVKVGDSGQVWGCPCRSPTIVGRCGLAGWRGGIFRVRVVSFSAKFANCLFVELAGGGENAKKNYLQKRRKGRGVHVDFDPNTQRTS